MQFLSALAVADNPRAAVDEICDQLGPLPNSYSQGLGLVYVTDALAGDAEGIVERLRVRTGVASWCGGTGLGVCGTAHEVFGEPAVSVLLCPLPQDSWCTFGPGGKPSDRLLAAHQQWLDSHQATVTLLHADPRHADVLDLVPSLGQQSFLVGGLLSSRGRYAHIAEAVGEGAVSGVMLDAQIPIATQLTQGCTPIGPRRLVTRADSQVLFELEHRPAMDVLAEDLAALGETPTNAADLHVAISVPGDDGGDYLVRNLMGASMEQRALVVAESLQAGNSVMFCRRDESSARKDLERMLGTLAARLDAPPRGGVYVSCLARGPNLFGAAGEETRIIREKLGDFPLTGFFANGELARDRIYAYTGVLTVFL